MARVLVIDDDAGTLFGYKWILRTAGHDVTTVALGEDGVSAARRDQFDVVLCDQRLPDYPGVEIVRQIRQTCPQAAIVLMTAWGTPELVIEAKESGATSFADKPLIGNELLDVVACAQRLQAEAALVLRSTSCGYASRRLADMIVRGACIGFDLKTVTEWSRSVGLARSTLKVWCRAAGVRSKPSLDLLRLLHIVMHHAGEPWDLQQRLDIINGRTADRLIHRAGFPVDSRVPTVESFLSRQLLVRSPELVEALRQRIGEKLTTSHLMDTSRRPAEPRRTR